MRSQRIGELLPNRIVAPLVFFFEAFVHRHAKGFPNHQTIPALERASDGRRLATCARYPLDRYTAIGSIAPSARTRASARIGDTSVVYACFSVCSAMSGSFAS